MSSDAEKIRFALPLVTQPATYFVRYDMATGRDLPADEQTPVVKLEDLEALLTRLEEVSDAQ